MNATPPKTDSNEPGEVLEGSVKSIVYHSEETGYTVLTVLLEAGGRGRAEKTASVVGSCQDVWQGEDIRAIGRWVRHPSHGLQFQASAISCIAPSSPDGIARYLASGIVKGIGEVWAKRIVDRFGDKTLEILEHDSGRLAEVKGLGKKRRLALKKGWEENHATRDTMIFLQGHGITSGTSAKIMRRYGANTVAVVKQNPYRLCADIDGIGFRKADEIARRVGVPVDSPFRARAGIFYTLETLAEEGHCFCEAPDLLLRAGDLLGIAMDVLETALEEEVAAGRLIRDGGRLYLKKLFFAERKVAERILAILDGRSRFAPIRAEAAVEWVAANKLPFAPSPAQVRAIRMGLENKFSVVTGGPGVGKTTIIRALCEVWEAKHREVHLVAPTGRAAKRMAESTGRPARTIHRLLKWNPVEGRFTYNGDNPVDGDVFIVDESSMIDIELAACLLSAIRPASTVVLVGDTDQLPSVGPGNVLRDVIDSGVVPFTKLDVIFRQKTGGWIVRNAHNVNRGLPFQTPDSAATSDFFFVPCEEPEGVLARTIELVRNRIPARCNLSPLEDIQVLTPMRKNLLGADSLNDALQKVLNPTGPALVRFGRAYRVGDRVMQIRNNYDKDVFNGDIGFVRAVQPDLGRLEVDFDGSSVAYSASELEELVHAYATSIHKSQGSEYPAVVIVLHTQHFKLLQRNLLYTAITRGRKLVCVVGSPRAVAMAIRNKETLERRTALADRLRGAGAAPPLSPVPEDA